ncbi:MAG: DUF3298 and DUF4163 domain-containing protein, partial [Eubacteriales bacterium]
MKTKSFIILIATFIMIFMSSGCIIINTPADSDALATNTSSPAPLASSAHNPTAPAASASMPVPPPPTTAPTPTPLAPLTVTDHPTQYANTYISVDIHCPEISGMQDAAMQNGINSGVRDYLQNQSTALEQQSVLDETNYGAHAAYSYASSYNVMRNDGHLLSILIAIQSYEGGAHPANTYATINAQNSNPGDQLTLADLFVSGTDYVSDINSEINAAIAADPTMSGTFWFTTIGAGQTFYLTDTQLVIVFDPYSIAPGAYGAPMFE